GPPAPPSLPPPPPPAAAGPGAPPQRVAELEERIASLTRLRGILVRRMPWLAAPADAEGGADTDAEGGADTVDSAGESAA
ncbi:hypothetical protein ABZ553_42265, partial [Streptomyces sparsogenes]